MLITGGAISEQSYQHFIWVRLVDSSLKTIHVRDGKFMSMTGRTRGVEVSCQVTVGQIYRLKTSDWLEFLMRRT